MRGSEDLHKLTDSIYKHLTESFNPGVRNLIVCGRAYHKALTGASVMAKSYIDAISKLGHNCRANCKGATRELGEALFQVADAYRHIQLQIDEATKGLLTDFLTPLENKLENEFRIESVAHHKRYLNGHKTMLAPYEKSQRTLNKVRKKSKSKSVVDDSQFATKVTISKDKLDRFRQQGLKLALLDERKYYCYVLDKCIFMAKKYSDYHRRGYELIASRMRDWEKTTFQPDTLPESSECLLEISHTGNGYGPPQARGDYSMMYDDPYRRAAVDYMRQMPDRFPPSDSFRDTTLLTRSITVPPAPNQGILVRAVYNHSAEGESQLNFVEGDVISLLGDKSDGWHYGHNSRTSKYGWFPLSFTEPLERGTLQMSQRFRSTGDLLDSHSVSDHGSLEQEALGLVRRPRSLYDPSQSRQTNGPSQLEETSPGYSMDYQVPPAPQPIGSAQPGNGYADQNTSHGYHNQGPYPNGGATLPSPGSPVEETSGFRFHDRPRQLHPY
ncbi:brain-specific angiogenesis inhibitor 1-associated protein 2-like isoform X2 [Liolophura sinensis]|uniref:brain-specific angiogenesis inhibitor 1-associated protein 2-like isoform X2 n=1 Tax=Liolophura sinensis TaxID=3198878 RepID=UPI003158D290